MIARDRVLAVERGRNRTLQGLGKCHQLGLRGGCAYAAARNEHRPRGRLDMPERGEHARLLRLRPERRHARKLRLA
jgi:hypothetical protein